MNYGAGNVTQCDADVPDVQSTQCTAGRVRLKGCGASRQRGQERVSQKSVLRLYCEAFHLYKLPYQHIKHRARCETALRPACQTIFSQTKGYRI